LARVAERTRTVGEEVGVEREHDVGTIDPEPRVDVTAEGALRTDPARVRRDRLPSVPAGLGELAQQRLDLPREGRRRDRPGEDPKPRAATRLRRTDGGLQGRR